MPDYTEILRTARPASDRDLGMVTMLHLTDRAVRREDNVSRGGDHSGTPSPTDRGGCRVPYPAPQSPRNLPALIESSSRVPLMPLSTLRSWLNRKPAQRALKESHALPKVLPGDPGRPDPPVELYRRSRRRPGGQGCRGQVRSVGRHPLRHQQGRPRPEQHYHL